MTSKKVNKSLDSSCSSEINISLSKLKIGDEKKIVKKSEKKVAKSHCVKKEVKKDEAETQKKVAKSHQIKREEKKKKNDIVYDYSLDLAYQYFDQRNSETKQDDKGETGCLHKETINQDDMVICIDCGETVEEEICEEAEWRYYGAGDNVEESDPSRCQYRNVVDKGITKDLAAMGFSTDVSNKANELYLTVTKGDIKRSNYRKGIMFACVFYAFIALEKPQTTEYIRKIFKISKRIVSKGFTYYGLEMPKEKRDQYVYITAEHYIPKIMNELNVKDEYIHNVLELYNRVKDKSYLLNTSNPQSIASGFVYYYLQKLKIDINPSKFGKVVNLSEITITRISNEIDDIITSDDILY